MTEILAMWLFGILGAWLIVLTSAIFTIKIEQVKIRVAVDIFIETMGEKIAKVLHADDDHLGLDSLLDKYLNRQYELSYAEWFELKNRCNHILADEKVSQLERSLAGMLAAVCEHKLIVKYGKTKDTV
jgi:hypothetical protein